MDIQVYEEAYFIPEGRCKKLLMLIDMCAARNQMGPCKKAKRDRFLEKVKPYVSARIANAVYHLGYTKWRVERTGSDNLNDIANMRNQSYRVMMFNKRKEQEK